MSSIADNTPAELIVAEPRRARDTVRIKDKTQPESLFDAFWLEGELAMLFGEPGAGKSLLAVQIADALSRGQNLLQPELPLKKRRKILDIDLVLTEKQFRKRYSDHEFASNVYRAAPQEASELLRWTEAMISKYGFDAVIIDDLSMVSLANDGTRETLALMHGLKRLTVETGVSILVLADSAPLVHKKRPAELGLRRSQVLCGVADSVFALHGDRIIQTRTRSERLVWTKKNPLRFTIEDLSNGLLGMEFALPKVSSDLGEDIVEIKEMHDERKMTFREIADEFGISRSYAQKLYSHWTPRIGRAVAEQRKKEAEEKAYWDELDAWRASGGKITFDYELGRWVKFRKDQQPETLAAPEPGTDSSPEETAEDPEAP